MEKIKVNVVSVRVFDQKEIPSVELTLGGTIKGFTQHIDENKSVSFVEADVNTVSINRSQLTRELCACNDLIDEYRGCRPTAFDQKAFALILRGAELTIVRESHDTGEVMTDADGNALKDSEGNDRVYKRDCYTTSVVGVKLTDRAVARLDAACTLD